jgi:PAS domain S-box-containing protein
MISNLFTRLERETGWSNELLYQLVENVKDYAIFAADLDGRIVSWNIGAEKLFGYTATQIIGRDIRLLFTGEDRESHVPEKEMWTAICDGVAEDERWHLRSDGSRFFASGLQTPLYNNAGKHTGYAKIARDLTERIEAQDKLLEALGSVEAKVHERTNDLNESNEALRVEVRARTESEKLRATLLRKIVRTQEDERKRIARDLHDNIGQQMTGLQLQLQLLLENHGGDASLAAEIAELKETANQVDSEVDFLAWELRPSVLDDLGLAAASEKYVREWSHHLNTPAEFAKVGSEGRHLLPEAEINLYRIIQEALNNVAKHAQASNVSVLLELRDNTVSLIIEDDGLGFELCDESAPMDDNRRLGLLGMRERAELIGGTFAIESSPGKGATLFVRVPACFQRMYN